jgi:hypothetical protein
MTISTSSILQNWLFHNSDIATTTSTTILLLSTNFSHKTDLIKKVRVLDVLTLTTLLSSDQFDPGLPDVPLISPTYF